MVCSFFIWIHLHTSITIMFFYSTFWKSRKDCFQIDLKLIQHAQSIQSDANNCGVYVCKYYQLLLNNISLEFSNTANELLQFRFEIKSQLEKKSIYNYFGSILSFLTFISLYFYRQTIQILLNMWSRTFMFYQSWRSITSFMQQMS